MFQVVIARPSTYLQKEEETSMYQLAKYYIYISGLGQNIFETLLLRSISPVLRFQQRTLGWQDNRLCVVFAS